VDWGIGYPKHKDLSWSKSTKNGKKELSGLPNIDTNAVEYNDKNVNNHKKPMKNKSYETGV